MRILVFFGDHLGVSRGTPSRARNMAAALAARKGVEVLAVSRDAELRVPGVDHRSLGRSTLPDAVASFRPAVVHGHTHKALPHLAAIDGCVRVADLHGDPIAEKLAEGDRPWSRRLRSAASLWLADRRFGRRVDGVTVVSEILARRAERRGLPTRVLWGGVDPDLFRASAGDPGEALRIGYAGNFRPYQGLTTLLRATRSLVESGVEARLLLVGDPGATGVDRLAEEMLPGRVELTGQLDYEQVPAALARANVLVVPRPDSPTARAGFPSKLPEYMALGKALVVTDVGEQPRAVEEGVSGLVVPPDDSSALAAALRRLRRQALRDRLGRAARAAAEGPLSWSSITDRLMEFFSELAA